MADDTVRYHIGTSGYSYPGEAPKGWYGFFYPRSAGRRVDELEFYASVFNSVEINSTFYRPAEPAMAQRWVDRTPSDFTFAVKVWQKFTHPTRLGEIREGEKKEWEPFNAADIQRFLDGIGPLAESGKLGALLFQYPPSFRCNEINHERLLQTLAAFAPYPKVIELRHRGWSDRKKDTEGLLERSGAAWAYIDEPKFPSSVKQELEGGGEMLYIRLHGRNYEKWWKHEEAWERYDYFYSAEQIQRLGERLKELAGKSPTTRFYIFFNNHARAQAAANALMLKAELQQGTKGAVPESLLTAFSDLRNLSR
jgi:uncharacterized protein YecE (DUF72 family)